MKSKYLVLCAIGFMSCRGNNDGNTATGIDEETMSDTIVYAPEEDRLYCFIRTEGTDNQDTITVHFIINMNKVEGKMKWIPKEKDGRDGILSGEIADNIIAATWYYTQEGIQDSMAVDFKLSEQELAQKPLKVNRTTGRQETDITADYTVIFVPDDYSKYDD